MSSCGPISAGLLMLASVLCGQSTSPKPAATPERRHRILADPITIARNLLSPSVEVRGQGFRQLGFEPTESRPDIVDLRLQFANLDEDPDLEAILILNDPRWGEAHAMVLDRTGSRWFCAGGLSGAVTVRDDSHDILRRQSPRGTDILIWTELSIYKMLGGRLYEVFATTEEMESHQQGPDWSGQWVNERHTVYFPEVRLKGGHYMVVHHTKAILGDEEPFTRANIPREARSLGCAAHRWDPARFRYVVDKAGTAHFCDPKTRRPRH